MADAKKCDRCGKFYDAFEFTIMSQKGCTFTDESADTVRMCYKSNITHHKYDLCLGCIEELMDWFGLKNVGSVNGVEKFVDKEGPDGEE